MHDDLNPAGTVARPTFSNILHFNLTPDTRSACGGKPKNVSFSIGTPSYIILGKGI
jgi:hypothetical protein